MAEAITINLKRYIDTSGVSALEIAKRAGVNRSAVYDILYGKSKNPGIITLVKIADAMGMSLPQLIVGDDAEAFAHRLSAKATGLESDDLVRIEAIVDAWLSSVPPKREAPE